MDDLGQLECQFYSLAHASNLSSVGPPNSTTHNRPDNCRSDDTMFDVLPLQELSVVQIQRSLLTDVMSRHLHLILLRIW